METIGEAKAYLRATFEDGASCPCCGQYVKLYRRSISGSMARTLIAMYRADVWQREVNATAVLERIGGKARNGGDFAKMAMWGLIEKVGGRREDGSSRAGLWRVTDKGKAFIYGEMVPRYCFVFDGKAQGFSEELRGIRECLGAKFDYDELMGRV